MKAVRIYEHGGLDKLIYDDLPQPDCQPDKVKINLEYMDKWSLWMDIIIIFRTIFRKNY